MGRIVERLILTKDNRVRDRGTLNRFDVWAPTWPSVPSPMGLADCIQLGLFFGPDALPKTHSLSTIKHYFTTLYSLTSEDCATLPKATKVRRIVTGQASGLTMQPTAGASKMIKVTAIQTGTVQIKAAQATGKPGRSGLHTTLHGSS